MEAPIYPPATAYEPPTVLPYELSAENCTMAELMGIPSAWAVVLKHAPIMKSLAEIPFVKQVAGTMTIVELASFEAPLDKSTIAAIDDELRRIPASERGAK